MQRVFFFDYFLVNAKGVWLFLAFFYWHHLTIWSEEAISIFFSTKSKIRGRKLRNKIEIHDNFNLLSYRCSQEFSNEFLKILLYNPLKSTQKIQELFFSHFRKTTSCWDIVYRRCKLRKRTCNDIEKLFLTICNWWFNFSTLGTTVGSNEILKAFSSKKFIFCVENLRQLDPCSQKHRGQGCKSKNKNTITTQKN